MVVSVYLHVCVGHSIYVYINNLSVSVIIIICVPRLVSFHPHPHRVVTFIKLINHGSTLVASHTAMIQWIAQVSIT